MDRMVQPSVGMSFFFLLMVLVPLLLVMLFINVIGISFTRLGFSSSFAFLLLVSSFVGSFINIPLKEVESKGEVITYRPSKLFWFFYEPVVEERRIKTIIAVNVGGAVVPILVSIFLMVKFHSMIVPMLAGTLVCVVVSHTFSRPVPGVGIAMPVFVAPLTSALVAVVLGMLFPGSARPVIAYVSGVLGVLIGADLLHLGKIEGLGAPVASIGGAGTFDGIFLTGILAVLLV